MTLINTARCDHCSATAPAAYSPDMVRIIDNNAIRGAHVPPDGWVVLIAYPPLGAPIAEVHLCPACFKKFKQRSGLIGQTATTTTDPA